MDVELEARIRQRAYELWQVNGCADGHDMDYWLQAEQELTDKPTENKEAPLEILEQQEERLSTPISAAA